MKDITIAISSDVRGFSAHATLIASILRRTTRNVWVKYWCRDFEQESFETDRLKVDFIPSGEKRDGNYPGHVPPAVFDRLEVIRQAPEWDRCLIMDHDMIVTCDLGDYFDEEFEGNLLMGRLFGSTLADAQILWRGATFPKKWAHTKKYPYFFMGPMMNLTAMRKVGTWDKILAAHEAFYAEEQIALTAACDGKIKGVDGKWNILSGEIRSQQTPEGLIHWTGWKKPWQWGTQGEVWRPEVWEAERCSWYELRCGEWTKPIAWELSGNPVDALALASRGWTVVAVIGKRGAAKLRKYMMPDIHLVEGRLSQGLIKILLHKYGQPDFARVRTPRAAQMLGSAGAIPQHTAITHAGDRAAAKKILLENGATAWAQVGRDGEPPGGRVAAGVEYGKKRMRGKTQKDEELHAFAES